MADIKSKYIDNATYVVSFQRDEKVRLRQAGVEKAFGPMLSNVQSIQTNIPDDHDPTAPRFIMQLAKKTLTVSQVAVQLTLSFESSTKSLHEQLDIIEKNVNTFCLAVQEFINESKIEHHGFIVSLNYKSSETQQEINDYIFKRFFSIKPYGETASTSFMVGFKTPELLFINFNASPYELREVKIKAGEKVTIRPQDLPLKEEGYSLKVDVNNRPMFMAGKSLPIIEIANKIKKEVRNIVENEADDFMGFATKD